MMTKTASSLNGPAPGEELLGAWPIVAIATFTLNNFVLKQVFANVVTGKLSDVTCCFFLPLFVSATLGWLGWAAPVSRRVVVGAIVTAVVFSLVKTSTLASAALNAAIAHTAGAAIALSPNRVDPTDLVALPLTLAAILYASRRFSLAKEVA